VRQNPPTFRPTRVVDRSPDEDIEKAELLRRLLEFWRDRPVEFVIHALGVQPEPWACDVLDAIVEEDNVALRACHGVGKTALLSWVVIWFTVTRTNARVPTTAPTFNRQVKDVLWAEIHKWWNQAKTIVPWLTSEFEATTTRLQHREMWKTWFALGVASATPFNTEGFHEAHLLAVIDEAKAVRKPFWESVAGMRTTDEAKLVVASTPGGPLGEFFRVFTEYRETWKSVFVIHPEQLRAQLRRPEAAPYSLSGTKYSRRVRDQFLENGRLEWGETSPAYIARCIGDFPDTADDVLIPYHWVTEAFDREEGAGGARVIACDVARYGRDRTVIIGGEGGVLLRGETVARTQDESTTKEKPIPGEDPKRPDRRSTVATADKCQQMRIELDAAVIVIDDTGVGGGVSDELRRRGERVLPLHFGAAPTDKPKDAEDAKARQRRHKLDSNFVDLKAQMGFSLRGAFEDGVIALSRLSCAECLKVGAHPCQHLLSPLMKQLTMEKYEMDAKGRYRLLDPDEQDEVAVMIGSEEGRKSPDHFHALILYWWVAAGHARNMPRIVVPQVPSDIARIGERVTVQRRPAGQAAMVRLGSVGGQASQVRRWYSGR